MNGKVENSMKKLRWGIIGAANIAVHSVIPAIQQSQTGEVVAIASRSMDKAASVASRLNIPRAYGSYEQLLADPDIDAVYIPLPNHLHAAWTIRSAQAGKHVLCEKPLALTAAEASEMAEQCRKAGVHLAEAFMYRHHPRYSAIRKLIAEGRIGQLRAIHGAFTFRNPDDPDNVRFRADYGGGALYDVGCYPISAARMIFNEEPEAVTCHAFFSERHDGVDMMSSGLIEFSGGKALTFDCGMWASGRNKLEIVGSDGRIEVPSPFVNQPGHFYVTDEEGRTSEHYSGQHNHYTLQADRFARVVWGEAEPLYPPEDAAANMRVIEACLTSARERRRVVL